LADTLQAVFQLAESRKANKLRSQDKIAELCESQMANGQISELKQPRQTDPYDPPPTMRAHRGSRPRPVLQTASSSRVTVASRPVGSPGHCLHSRDRAPGMPPGCLRQKCVGVFNAWTAIVISLQAKLLIVRICVRVHPVRVARSQLEFWSALDAQLQLMEPGVRGLWTEA